jgi:arylsulfatase A-like enzyme
MHTRRGRVRLYGVLALALLAVACSERVLKTVGPRRPNVILITIDTLRRDHVSCYGYPKLTTPFLDSLAEQGVRFDNAYATSSWTVPTTVSILSSLYSMTHGIRWGAADEHGVISEQPIVDLEIDLLPELLHRAGYRTLAVTANGHLDGRLGFARGFDSYHCAGFVSGEALLEPIEEAKKHIDKERPYFLWVHYFDPHAPYDTEGPKLPEFLGKKPDQAMLKKVCTMSIADQFQTLDVGHDAEAMAYAKACYDSDIRFTDRLVTNLFEQLHIGPDDMVVITSDHGEEFHEHGRFGHGHTVFDELLRVPLIVLLPGRSHAGDVVATRVSLIDLMPTILDVASVDPPKSAQGRTLLPLMGHRTQEDRVTYASTAKIDEIRTVIVGRFKLIHPVDIPRPDMLFDLENDPGEQYNLIDERPQQARELRKAMAILRMSRRRPGANLANVPIPPERIEELRSLGYLR